VTKLLVALVVVGIYAAVFLVFCQQQALLYIAAAHTAR